MWNHPGTLQEGSHPAADKHHATAPARQSHTALIPTSASLNHGTRCWAPHRESFSGVIRSDQKPSPGVGKQRGERVQHLVHRASEAPEPVNWLLIDFTLCIPRRQHARTAIGNSRWFLIPGNSSSRSELSPSYNLITGPLISLKSPQLCALKHF